jgi:hypothetical protein
MIPDFDTNGNLPPGVHETTLDDIEVKFTSTLKRKEHFELLKQLIKDLKAIGCKTIYIDGSYITRKSLPNDIDICWESNGVDLNTAKLIMPILWDFRNGRYAQQKKYHADIFPARCIELSSKLYFLDFFQVDKNTGESKGIIKLQI